MKVAREALDPLWDDPTWEGKSSPPMCLPVADPPSLVYFHNSALRDAPEWRMDRFRSYLELERDILIGIELARTAETRGFVPVMAEELLNRVSSTWYDIPKVPVSDVVPYSRELPGSVVRRLLKVALGGDDYPQELVSTNITGVAPEKVVIYRTVDLPVRALRINVLNHRDGTVAELPPYRRDGEFTEDGYYGVEPDSYSDGHPDSYKYQPVGEAFVPRPWWTAAEAGGPAGRSPYAGRSFAPVASLPPSGADDLYESQVPMTVAPTAPTPQPAAAPSSQVGPAMEALLTSDQGSEPSVNGDDVVTRQPPAVDILRGELSSRELLSIPHVRRLADDLGDGTVASIFASANGRYIVRSALDGLALSCITLAARYKQGREQRNIARERRRTADREVEAARLEAAELRTRVGELEGELEDARRLLQQAVIPEEGGEEAVQPGYSRRRARSPDEGLPERNVRTRLHSPVGAADASNPLLARLDARLGSPESPDVSPPPASIPAVGLSASAVASSHGPVPARRRGSSAVPQRGLRRNPTFARVAPRHPRPSTNVRAPAPTAPSASHRPRPSSHYRR